MPSIPLPPWEAISPEFTDARLRALRDVIAKARADKLALRQPQDISWNLCCDCFAWAWAALHDAAAGPFHDWLYVPGNPGNLNKLFFVGGPAGVPAKFYRVGSPGQPERTAHASAFELNSIQYQIPFGGTSEVVEPALGVGVTVVRFAVDVKPDLTAGSVKVQTLDFRGGVVYEWEIPSDASGVLPLSTSIRPEAVELSEPPVELSEDAEERARVEAQKKRDEEENDRRRGA
jgi:hypothetical protein